MKTSVFRLSCLLLAAVLPLTVAAQNSIRKAFDAIIKCPQARIVESHTLDRDPATDTKYGQSEVYRFVLPADKSNLVRNVMSAFDKDTQKAYSIYRGNAARTDSDILLAVGDDSGKGIKVNDPGCEYIYALFLAPKSEDPNGIYRYAYAMNCKEEDGMYKGKLIVTYATTLKYRQAKVEANNYKVIRSFSDNASVIINQDGATTWFDKLMTYFQGMRNANDNTRIALATKAFKLIKNMSDHRDVTNQDKNAAREILKAMISGPEYSEPILKVLLQRCLAEIK